MVHPHHLSAAQADQGKHRLQVAAVRPEIKDTDLGLGGAVGGVNEVSKLTRC